MQAATTLMGPFMVIFFGMGLVTLPEAARVLRRSPRHLPCSALAVSVGLSLLAMAWAVVLLVALPRGLGHWLLGRSGGRPTRWCCRWPSPSWAAASSAGAGTGLHALGAARRSLRAMVQASALFLVAGLAGAVTDGTVGTMRGAAFAGLRRRADVLVAAARGTARAPVRARGELVLAGPHREAPRQSRQLRRPRDDG